jgi:CHAD domain-containing protein
MSFDLERIRKSTRRVAKFLRKNSRSPNSDAVHNLRTSTRSLETSFSTLGFDSKRMVRRLLRDLGDVRKRAGKVRDMDVLTSNALTVQEDGEQDCLVQLLEYLGAGRNKHVKRLRRTIKAAGGQLRRNLKRSSKRLEEFLERAEDEGPMDTDAVPTTMARTITLSAALNIPSRLNRKTLHPYRLKVKELRNVLQLSEQTGDKEFLEKLGEVKDAIGEWHDWEELIAIAKRLLDHGPACKLIKDLHENSNSKYERALFITERFRTKYLESGRHKRRTRSDKIAPFSVPVFRATSAIAQ